MKVFISADMEGISGKVHWEFSKESDSGEWDRDRQIMSEHVKAAIEGAIEGGASEIVINDSHMSMRNLTIDRLDFEQVQVITGQPKPLCMMEGVDNTYSAAFLIGYHGMSGAHPGVLNHSFCPLSIREIKINGIPVGELGVNAGIAGYFNVPIALVAGDNVLAEEAQERLGEVEAAIIKEAVNMTTAKCLPLKAANELIKQKSKAALERCKDMRPLVYDTPTEIEVDFFMTNMADAAALIPGSQRKGGTTVSYNSSDFLELFKAFQAMFMLGEKVRMELLY
jgi:D-amino peptidase